MSGLGLIWAPILKRGSLSLQTWNSFQRWGLHDLTLKRGFRTTSTEHPVPVYRENERILDKVLQDRSEDLPVGMENPYKKPVKKCVLCEYQITPNYKNIKLLSQFVSPYTGLTYEKHVTGLCKAMHELVQTEIQRARKHGLMAYYFKHPEFLKDPKICDPERPFRPHKH